MDDFLHRTITESIEFTDKEGGRFNAKVMRTRTSGGFASIALDVKGKRVLELTDDLDDYEGTARAIAKLLADMADRRCMLPEVPPA
jgi:hypothetical protein